MQTGLKGSRSAFVGPFSCSLDLDVLWCRHCGSPDTGQPRILLELRGGLLQVHKPLIEFIMMLSLSRAKNLSECKKGFLIIMFICRKSP